MNHGDMDLVPAGYSESWQEHDPATFLAVELSPALVRRAAEDSGRGSDRVGLERVHQFRDPQIEHIAWALNDERQAGYPTGSLYTESLGIALAVRLLGHGASELPARGGLTGQQLRRVKEYIHAHINHPLSLSELAAVAGVSVSHLKVSFRQQMGMPVHSYVIRRRVEHAKSLLLQGRLSVTHIAAESGFAHQSHLARWMRRLLGVTPTALARSAGG